MILPIKPICKKEWVRRDGTSVIFLQYCRNSEERVLVDTGLAIPPDYWNRKNNRINPALRTHSFLQIGLIGNIIIHVLLYFLLYFS